METILQDLRYSVRMLAKAPGFAVVAVLTLAGSKAASSLLFGLKPHDPLTLVLATVILAAIGFGASFVPARRATRVDPMVALRYE